LPWFSLRVSTLRHRCDRAPAFLEKAFSPSDRPSLTQAPPSVGPAAIASSIGGSGFSQPALLDQ
jgi:hypothetical protein